MAWTTTDYGSHSPLAQLKDARRVLGEETADARGRHEGGAEGTARGHTAAVTAAGLAGRPGPARNRRRPARTRTQSVVAGDERGSRGEGGGRGTGGDSRLAGYPQRVREQGVARSSDGVGVVLVLPGIFYSLFNVCFVTQNSSYLASRQSSVVQVVQ
jgi:hypothetical protein